MTRLLLEWERQWQKGSDAVTAAFSALPQADLLKLRALARAMVAQKEAMQELVAKVDASAHCAGCGGACCVSGKYHFTAVDLLVYLATDGELFAPRFDNGRCPYLGEPRCLIPTGYRPFNCITFNCDVIEDRLSRDALSRFYLMERELRLSYGEIRSLFPAGTMDGSLLRE